MPRLSGEQLATAFRTARGLGIPFAVHSESQAIIDLERERLRRQSANDLLSVARSRPPEAEREAVRQVVELARASRARLHLVHISDPETVVMIVRARLAGVDVSIETCPHYLSLSREDLERIGVWGVCQPPLNGPGAVDGMWRVLQLGYIDNIASDHCAYTWEEKNPTDAWAVAPGINGIQLSLPVVVHEARRRGVPLNLVARLFSANPARRFSLYPKKGAILPGSDADLVFVDPESSLKVAANRLFTRCPGSAYDGMSFQSRVVRTMLRGTTVYSDDGGPRIEVEPGFGESLRPVREAA
jgi:allantoinase